MSDLTDLYQEVILDHYKRPRNNGPLEGADHTADGYNPLCGDRVKILLRFDGERVVDVHFEGVGCAISTASASLMTEAVKGHTRQEVEEIFTRFHDMLTGDPSSEAAADEELGKLRVFAGVREYPVRVKCATLAWHTLRSALDESTGTATTE